MMRYKEESLGPKKSLDSYDSKNSIMINISISVEHGERIKYIEYSELKLKLMLIAVFNFGSLQYSTQLGGD